MDQGTWSAYRVAVVTKRHRSAASTSWSASARFARSIESMSGASTIARPGAIVLVFDDLNLVQADTPERAFDQRPSIVRMDQNNGDAGGGAQNPCRARGTSGQGVEKSALSRSGRPENQNDQGRVQAIGSDPQVAFKVVDKLPAAARCGA